MISTVEDMSRFLSNLNRLSMFKTAQGSDPTTSRSLSSSIVPAIALSPVATVNVLLVAAGVLLPSLIKTEVLVSNLLVFFQGRSILHKLLLTRGNG